MIGASQKYHMILDYEVLANEVHYYVVQQRMLVAAVGYINGRSSMWLKEGWCMFLTNKTVHMTSRVKLD